MIVRVSMALAITAMLAGCAHKELKAPCGPLSYAGSSDPCGDLMPINVADTAIVREIKG